MWNAIKVEWLKLRRCSILLVGVVALALCPIVQYGSWLITAEEYREASYDFAHLFSSVVWGNTQVFLPISLVMMGGWFIDREQTCDTLKNLLTVPLPMPRLLVAKLIVTAALAALFGLYSACVTVLTGVLFALPGLSPALAVRGGAQIVAAALTTFWVCMPLILIFGRIRGAYLGGSILTFFLGYSVLFFKGGFLASAYPFSAALILVGFDMARYNGATASSLPLALFGMSAVATATLLLLAASGKHGELAPGGAKKRNKHARGARRR